MNKEVTKKFLVSIEDRDSLPYIKRHIGANNVQILTVKGSNYDLHLKYDISNEKRVIEKYEELKNIK